MVSCQIMGMSDVCRTIILFSVVKTGVPVFIFNLGGWFLISQIIIKFIFPVFIRLRIISSVFISIVMFSKAIYFAWKWIFLHGAFSPFYWNSHVGNTPQTVKNSHQSLEFSSSFYLFIHLASQSACVYWIQDIFWSTFISTKLYIQVCGYLA